MHAEGTELQAIDRSAFEELRAYISPAFMTKLVDTFVRESPRMLADLRRGRDTADAELFRRAAHTLKSNSATFGAMELMGMARAMELGGLEADASSDHTAICELEQAWQRAVEELRALTREGT